MAKISSGASSDVWTINASKSGHVTFYSSNGHELERPGYGYKKTFTYTIADTAAGGTVHPVYIFNNSSTKEVEITDLNIRYGGANTGSTTYTWTIGTYTPGDIGNSASLENFVAVDSTFPNSSSYIMNNGVIPWLSNFRTPLEQASMFECRVPTPQISRVNITYNGSGLGYDETTGIILYPYEFLFLSAFSSATTRVATIRGSVSIVERDAI